VGTVWQCVDCGTRYRRVNRAGASPTAQWDHDAFYRLRRAVILGVIGVPIVLIVFVVIGVGMIQG
jgi:hypothetical protein